MLVPPPFFTPAAPPRSVSASSSAIICQRQMLSDSYASRFRRCRRMPLMMPPSRCRHCRHFQVIAGGRRRHDDTPPTPNTPTLPDSRQPRRHLRHFFAGFTPPVLFSITPPLSAAVIFVDAADRHSQRRC